MIDFAPLSLTALCGTALALGARHALDADHLTVIDAVARRNALVRPRLAAAGGVLFSLGHVAVVGIVTVMAAWLSGRIAAPPMWLEVAGIMTSATVLLALGVLNIGAALAARAGEPVSPVGWKARIAPVGAHPLTVAATGRCSRSPSIPSRSGSAWGWRAGPLAGCPRRCWRRRASAGAWSRWAARTGYGRSSCCARQADGQGPPPGL